MSAAWTFWLAAGTPPETATALSASLKHCGASVYAGGEPPPDTSCAIAVVSWLDGQHDALIDSLLSCRDQHGEFTRRFVVFAPVPSSMERLVQGLPAVCRASLTSSSPVLTSLSPSDVRRFLEKEVDSARPNPIFDLFLQARAQNRPMGPFGHNADDDIVNRILAPARLMLLQRRAPLIQQAHKDLWSRFEKEVLAQGPEEELTALHRQLQAMALPIRSWIMNGAQLSVRDLSDFMSLMTTIRQASGTTTQARRGKSDREQSQPKRGSPSYLRLLVVDDHSRDWECVFNELRVEVLQQGVDLQIEYSADGKSLLSSGPPVTSSINYSAYDLVILDVFLGAADGRQVLKRIRRDTSTVPVLLWTTSQDPKILSDAYLANGILLKKALSWEDFRESVLLWCCRGYAARTKSLPNAFFNHAIISPACRELAVAMHEWCLKQLDSFHALDNEFFRYFTDHGGRHIVKLWELLERALQPFLHGDKELLADDRDERELELLGLYLAVICHELGMFPMRIGGAGGAVENFAAVDKQYLNDVRALHAARGMVLLADDKRVSGGSGRFWNDRRGRELGGQLRADSLKPMAARVATLVGYHARLFKSLQTDDFLNWGAAGTDLNRKLKSLGAPSSVLSRTDGEFRLAFRRVARIFWPGRGDGSKKGLDNSEYQDRRERCERLRRQCALFRFVDALDITASRNPADFLIGTNSLPAKQYGENLKRELCIDAGFNNGDVFVVMSVKPPAKHDVAEVLRYVKEKRLLPPKEQPVAVHACGLIDTKPFEALIATPWMPPEGGNWTEPKWLDERSAKCFQKPLDAWLASFWQALLTPAGSADFIGHLRKMKILDMSQDPRLLFDGAEIICGLAALSVAGEILDEYAAIVDGQLNEKIRLSAEGRSSSGSHQGFVWRREAWRDKRLPTSLTSLAKFLPKDEFVGFETPPAQH